MKALLDGYHRMLKRLLTILMGVLIVPVTIQILSRYTGLMPRYIWTEEVARFCFVWMIMIGAMIAVRDKSHFEVDVLPAPRTPRQAGIAGLVVHLGMMVMAVAFVRYGYEFAKFGFIQTSEMSGINMLSIYIAFPLAGVTWVLFLAEKMVADVRLIRSPATEPHA
ncbi:TRAP transporter small permease [Synoicihabitans lomoniglobus]|uniref:TRAP transporter small permease n=1 Tax=Synoicihabitans lomoniglobus TaxID=2909285 RepID=A0AAE9ZYK0_9BACT|nr:TRAP transporter small permease [Opitutaceae bacterium LMO-M01]WED65594.1 TRAP transporter small permease [Opitutaceae bacterium LMO-M01]